MKNTNQMIKGVFCVGALLLGVFVSHNARGSTGYYCFDGAEFDTTLSGSFLGGLCSGCGGAGQLHGRCSDAPYSACTNNFECGAGTCLALEECAQASLCTKDLDCGAGVCISNQCECAGSCSAPQYTGENCYDTYCWDCLSGSVINGVYFGGTGVEFKVSLSNDPYTMTGDVGTFEADLQATISSGSTFPAYDQPIALNGVISGARWIEIAGLFYQFDQVSCPDAQQNITCDELGFTAAPSPIYSGEEVTFSISGLVIDNIDAKGISFGDDPFISYDLTPRDSGAVSWFTGHTYTSGGTFTGEFTYSTGGDEVYCYASVSVERCGDGIQNGLEACDLGINANDSDGCSDDCRSTFDVSLEKVAAPTTVLPGQSIEYAFTVTSLFGTSSNVIVTDTLPAGQAIYAFESMSEDVVITNSGTSFTWNATDIGSGQTTTLYVYATVSGDQIGSVTNTGYITASMDFDSSNDSDTAVVTILNECGEGYDTYSIHYTDFYTGYIAGTYLDESAGWTIGNYIVYKNGEVVFTGNTQEETDTQQHLTRRYASIPAVDSGDRIDALLVSVDDGAGNESTLEIDLFGDYGCVYTGNLTNFNDCIDDGIEDFLTLEGYVRNTNYNLITATVSNSVQIRFINRHNPSVAWVGFDLGTVLDGISQSVPYTENSDGTSASWDPIGNAEYTTECGILSKSFNAFPVVDFSQSTFNEIVFDPDTLTTMSFFSSGDQPNINREPELYSVSCPIEVACDLCGPAHMQSGSLLFSGDSTLCITGSIDVSFIATGDADGSGNAGYTWTCDAGSGSTSECWALASAQFVCADGILETGEECEAIARCDDGSVCDASDVDACVGVGDEECLVRSVCENNPQQLCTSSLQCGGAACNSDNAFPGGCTTFCTLETLSCTITVEIDPSFTGELVTGTVATETRVLTGDVDWDESVDMDVMFVGGTGVAENIYMTMGTYTVTGTVYHPLSGSVTAICTDTIVIDGEMGAPDTPDCSDILLEGTPDEIYINEEVVFTINPTTISQITGMGMDFGDGNDVSLLPWDSEAVSWSTGYTYTSTGTFTGTFTYTTGDGSMTDDCTTTITVLDLADPLCTVVTADISTGYDLLDINSITCTGSNAEGYIVNILSGGVVIYTGVGGAGASFTDNGTPELSGGTYSVTCIVTGNSTEDMCPSTEYSAPYCGDGESSGEECDATAGDDGCYAPGHASECTREPLVCDTTDITTNPSYEGEQVTFDIYMFDESYIQMDSELYYGDGEDSGSWTIDGGTYNHTYTSGGTYNWSYQILHTGSNETTQCTGSVVIQYCGDSSVQTGGGEQCDFGDTISGDGCDSTCQWETPSCDDISLSYDPAGLTGEYPVTLTGEGNVGVNTWILFSDIDFDDSDVAVIDADQFTEAHTYTDAGTYTVVVTIENTLEGSGNYTTTCSTGFVVTPPPGAPDCGSEVEINVDYTSGYDTMTINDVVCSGAGIVTEDIIITNQSGVVLYSSGDSYPVVVDGADGDILIECVVNSGGPQSTCPETIVGVAYCGDGETWSGPEEECETEDGCEEVGEPNQCMWQIPTCEVVADPTTIYSGETVSFTVDYTPDPFPSGGGWTISSFTYGDSTQDSDVTDGVSDHDYNGSGNAYVYSFTVSNPNGSGEVCTGTVDVSYCGDGTIDGGNGEICDGEANCDVLTCECESGYSWDGDSCEVDATDAVCGTTHLSDIYDIDNNGDSLSGGSNNLCDAGTVANFVYATGTYTWNWDCLGLSGGNDISCEAYEHACGDGNIDGGDGETCDDGLNNGEPGMCNSTCNGTVSPLEECGTDYPTTYYTTGITQPDVAGQGALCTNTGDDSNIVEVDGVWTWDCTDESSCTATNEYCGDGIDNGTEECDDGNGVDDDECNNNCEATSCGDGVINGDEQCDEGLDNSPSGTCMTDCTLTYCGDSVQQSPNGQGTGGPSDNGVESCDEGPEGGTYGDPDAPDFCNETCESVEQPWCHIEANPGCTAYTLSRGRFGVPPTDGVITISTTPPTTFTFNPDTEGGNQSSNFNTNWQDETITYTATVDGESVTCSYVVDCTIPNPAPFQDPDGEDASGISADTGVDLSIRSQIEVCENEEGCVVKYKSDDETTADVDENNDTVDQTLQSIADDEITNYGKSVLTAEDVSDAFARALYIPIGNGLTALELFEQLGFFDLLQFQDGQITKRDLIIAMVEILIKLGLLDEVEFELDNYKEAADVRDLRLVAVALRKVMQNSYLGFEDEAVRGRVAVGDRSTDVGSLLCRRNGRTGCEAEGFHNSASDVEPSKNLEQFYDVDPSSRVGQALAYVNAQRNIFHQKTFNENGSVQVAVLYKTLALSLELEVDSSTVAGEDRGWTYLKALQNAGYFLDIDPSDVALNHSVTRGELQMYLTDLLQTAQLLPSTSSKAGPSSKLATLTTRGELVIALQQLIQLFEMYKQEVSNDIVSRQAQTPARDGN